MDDFEVTIIRAKQRLLKLHHDARCGHLGGNMSCIDAMMVLHHRIMNKKDRFILSKGHAAGALYATLWSIGKLDDQQMATFTENDSVLPGHPSGSAIPGVLFPTGSLGHGPSLANGLALAARYATSDRHVYCLCSDGEWQEGSCWEALMFAVHNKLANMTLLIDQNGLQGFGRTKDIVSFEDVASRIEAFGAHVVKVNGHETGPLEDALKTKADDRPTVVVMETVKGLGLHYEDKLKSHYLPLNDKQFEAAYAALEEAVTS
ncbi:MAG: transketolase [Tateyamaria sp.]|uniref:1-deoxy-D-xylulose-5-phosphate synthase N-terminal domain-containing protein n=1 Tax=Tateyamaria sp. TaxID=1929288 RepID=UPI00329F1B07